MIAHPSTLTGRAPLRPNIRVQLLPVPTGTWITEQMQSLQVEARATMRAAFPRALKRFAVPLLRPCALSKAREGYVCSPLFRAGLCLLALRVGGADRAQAQLLVNRMKEWVDRFWPEQATPAVRSIVPRLQAVDAAEDAARTAYLLGEPGARERWLELTREHQAIAPEVICALEAEGATA